MEARCIGIENITGPISRPRDNVLRALYKCGEDDIMGTNVMRAVLDWKWQKFAGSDYRCEMRTARSRECSRAQARGAARGVPCDFIFASHPFPRRVAVARMARCPFPLGRPLRPRRPTRGG